MVLESLVAGLLNTYLGRYIEDLDTTNLGISLFGGDVELTDLQLRPEALYELELPLEVKAGYVEKLSVDIPWTSLYTSPVKASLEGVYVVAGPVTDRKYDAKREKRLLDAVKRKKLQELDTPQNSPAQPDDEEEKRKEQTFTEKLTATILNNLQLTIKKIHIRYEDKVSNPSSPFALGLTLRSFSGQSVNSRWEPVQVDSRATQMFKLIKLEDLAVYWNTGCKKLVCDYLTTDLWKDLMEECLDTCRIMKQDLDFVVRPISAVTKIAFDKSQMVDLDKPRLWTDLAVQEIMVSLSRQQFKSMVCLVESFKLMAVNRLYRKYHPNLPVRGNAKAWWHYAYNATVQEHIRPYSWESIKAYRRKFQRYQVLYKEKLEESEDVAAISGVLEELESDLNLTSILVARQQAKLQFVKKEKVQPKKKKPSGGGGGWFWGWFSESIEEEEEIEEKESDFLSKLTEEERKKLYEGIGYSEDDVLPDKPKEYVENRFNFSLKSCCFKLRNHGMDLVNSKLEEVFAMFEQRPSAKAFRFSLSTENLIAEGVKQDDNSATVIVKPDIAYKGPDEKLFSAEVEMNPLYTTADSALRVAVQPVKILYDAVTVAETVHFFSMSSSSFEELKNAANRQLAKLAKVGRLSVQHAIEKHKTLNVNINLKAPYIIIPEGGSFSSNSRLLMADLGSLQINSDLQPDDVVLQGATMSELVQRLYDRFNIDISNIQLLFLQPGVDIEEARQEEDSPHHILPKMGLQLSLYNSINPQYRAQPRHKMEALLPSLKLNISETNIFALLQFLNSFPSLAESELSVDEVDSTDIPSSMPAMDYREVVSDETVKQLRAVRRALNQAPVDKEKVVLVTEESVEAEEVGTAPQPPIQEDEDLKKEDKMKTGEEEEGELSTKTKTTVVEGETETAKEDSSTVMLPTNIVRMNVAARLGNLGILLCDSYHTLAQINIKGLESNIIQMRRRTIVRARLEDLLVQDSAQSTLYPRILCIEDEDVFSLKFVAYDQAAEAAPAVGALDYHCKLRLGRLQLVYLPKFVNNVTNFFSPFSAPAVATQAVDTAQTILQQQVKDVEDRGHRVGLHIDVQAPVVILPETSTSPDTLLARLGDLSIRNSFVQEGKVPVDKIIVNLSSMQVSRAKFGDQQALSAQRLLLEPVGLHVEVCRQLRVGNPGLPQISISGKLENFKIHLGQPDLKTIFAILSGEQDNEGVVEVDTPEQQQEEEDPEGNNDNPQQSGTQEVPTETARSPIIRTKLTLNFDMDGMDLILYKTNNTESIFYSLDQDGFSHFQLHGISVDVETRDNNTIEACFLLQMVMLDDIRPKSPLAVKKMIYHYNKQGTSNDTSGQMQSENDSAADKANGNIPPVVLTTLDVVDAASALTLHKPLVKMTYKQDKDSQDIDLSMEGLRINLCIPYLLAVAEFFTVGNSSQEDDNRKRTNPTEDESSPPVASPPPTPTSQSTQPGRTFKAVGRLSKPEIVLFAYPSSKESRILVLRTEIDFSYERNSLQDSFSAGVNQLEVFSSLYSALIVPEGSCSVLRPCNIKFERTVFPHNKAEKLLAEFEDVNVHISPTVLHIVMAVLRSWNSGQVLTETDEPMKKEPLTDLWSPKAILPSKFRKKRKTEGGHGAAVKNKTPPQTFVIDMDSILFVLELEVGETYMPSLCVKSGVEAIMSDWSSQMRMKADVHLEATFHNEKLGVWEPLIEPIMEKNGTYRPWDICFKMVNAPSRHLCPTMYDCEDFGNMKPVDTVVRTAMYRDDSDESETSPDDTDSFGDRTSLLARRQRSLNRDQVDSGRGVAKPVKHVSMETGPAHKSEADQREDDEEEGFWDTIENALLFSSSSESEGEEDGGKELVPKFVPPVSDSDSGEEADNESVTSKSIDEVDAPTRDEEEVKMATYLVLDSADLLQVTLTPEAIGAIKDIAEAFSAGPSKPFKTGKPEFPSVEIENKLGFHLTVHVHPDLQIEEVKNETITIVHEERKTPEEEEDTVDCFKNPFKARKPNHSSSKLASAFANVGNLALLSGAFVYNVGLQKNQPVKTKDHIKLEVPGFDPLQIPCRRAGSFIHQLTPSKKTAYSVVCDVEINHGRRRITLRSPLQVSNQLPVSMVMTCDLSLLPKVEDSCLEETDDNKRALLGTVSPGQTCPVPLFAAYQAALEIRPEGTEFVAPKESLKWPDVAGDKGVKTISCGPEETGTAMFFYNVTWEASPVRRLALRNMNSVPYGTLSLHSPVVIHNYLPYEVSYMIGERPEVSLSAGVSVPSCSLDMEKNHKVDVHLRGYQGLDWSGKFYISLDMDEYEMVVMETTSMKGEKKQMALGVHTTVGGSRDVFLYAPYWLVNKTALPVEFRGAGSTTVYQGNTTNDPALFSFHRHRRKKMRSVACACTCVDRAEKRIRPAKMRMFRSKWSSAIPLDTVGHAGVVTCRDKDSGKVYQVWLEIQLSKLKLTKMVTLLPFFMVVNKTTAEVTFTEEGQEEEYWTVIQPEEVLPLWPHSGVLNLVVRQPGVENKGAEIPVLSQYFPIHKSHSTVLRMWNGTALTVNVAGGTESPTTITFTPFQPGDAPVRVVNCCHNAFIRFHQKGMSQVIVLTPNQSVLYTWDDPTEERTLWWNLYKRDKPSFPARINQDNAGIETVILPGTETPHGSKKNGPSRSKQKRTNIHWVSYLDGLQRVLFFTEDASLAQDVREASGEKTSLEAFLSLEGLGVSLVSSLYTEIAYLSITSTPPLWEVNSKGDSWKMLKPEVATFLEDQFRHGHPEAVIPDKVRVDFQSMRMVKPTAGGLRRTYQPGLWFQYRSSDHHTGMHAKLQRLQLDNQLQTAVFPTVLYPAPLPRKVLKKMGPRPFIELALMRRQVPEQHSDTIKYCKLLLQQFSVRVDKGFLLTVTDFFTTHMEEEEESAKLQSDYGKINLTLRDTVAALATSGTDKIYLEYFHFSPVKLFISFSLSGEPHLTHEQKDTITKDVVDFFLGTVGTTLTSLKDVEMKLAYFERRGVMLTQTQLVQEVQSHYTGQAIQQSYVLLLGLDVIGNPYGLVTKIGKGLGDLFYEPYQGAIEGPEQFAEGVARGVQSLLGHAVGGTAGALSSITGSVGKAFSLLSMDEDYSTRRRQRMQQQPSDMPSSLLLAGQSFIMGIVMGISGVVLQPVKGAQQEGVEGFFKGIGKGLLGLFSRPVAGVFDMVSMSFDAVRRSAEVGHIVVHRQRVPRFINPETGLTPYSAYQAVGNTLLLNIERGKYAETDMYVAHAAVNTEQDEQMLLITDQRILLVDKCFWFSGWDVEWDVPLDHIVGVPTKADGKLSFQHKEEEETPNLFTAIDKEVNVKDQQVLKWLYSHLEQALDDVRGT
ncbi:PREDICTED: vacuolar protein sorting-associated protein 13A-like [Branchiostoma belcheri]|uniref:Vacuolar protein sorting-associated protein 13A-like n=1 Tax=Branchiostoma belcheri TaxID=7741 RepID=A0A6P5AJ53_BRABE|nr:PREDICTED: vacuolar protein sorting-associated protein 13A-like [Branchiostoma belcheri]